jgi:hypothetical protein
MAQCQHNFEFDNENIGCFFKPVKEIFMVLPCKNKIMLYELSMFMQIWCDNVGQRSTHLENHIPSK